MHKRKVAKPPVVTLTQQAEAKNRGEPAVAAKVEPTATRTVRVIPLQLTRRRWNFDESSSREVTVRPPSGFVEGNFTGDEARSRVDREGKEALVKQAAMAVATAPGKQILMTAFMLWMSGGGLQIFSIMMLSMAFWQPLQKIMNIKAEFARFADSQVNLTLEKLVFIACNLGGIAVALYKCQTLGLLPTSAADWMGTPPVRAAAEFAAGTVLYG